MAHLRLRDFRNYARLDLDFAPGFHLILGQNAQGKTNLLEAIYLVATLRSFRGVGSAQMARQGRKGYFVGAKVISLGENDIKIYWSPRERKLDLNGEPVRKLTDYWGVLRAVVFCSEDLQLAKGPATRRRRFMDLLLAQTRGAYLPLLQRYNKALWARNALLKQPRVDPSALDGFTRELVGLGDQLIQFRAGLLPQFAPLAREAYRRITGGREELDVRYQPAVREDFALELARSHARELAFRSTVIGPHRDELRLLIDSRSAAQFGSEGQKRSLVIALKMAQAEFLTALHGTAPVLLLDDVMGELDASRRSAFLPLLQSARETRSQVFMTATEENWPRELAREAAKWEVREGAIHSVSPSH